MFPVQSTSVETDAIARVVRVMERTRAAKKISYGAVYNCRKIEGSSVYSQHAWGNAIDLFPTLPASDDDRDRKIIADAVVYHTTHKTMANRGRKLDVAQVIDHSGGRIWTPALGWHPYSGTAGDHVHVSGSPMRDGIPPCAA
jgi:hypothetical protein